MLKSVISRSQSTGPACSCASAARGSLSPLTCQPWRCSSSQASATITGSSSTYSRCSPRPRGAAAAGTGTPAGCGAGASGRYRSKQLPWPGAPRTVIAPWWAATTPCTTDSPSPVPCPTGLVVKKGSKTRWRVSSSMPQPSSCTHRCAYAPAGRPATAPGATAQRSRPTTMCPLLPCRACQALVHRFISTCCICAASAATCSGSGGSSSCSSTCAGSVDRSSAAVSCSSGCSGCTSSACGWRGPWRLKVTICCTRLRARSLAWRMRASRACASGWSASSCCSSATCPSVAARMLLKSCAMPPASVPMASIFCDCSSCASSAARRSSAWRRAVMSVTMASCPAGRPSPSVTVLVDSVAQSTLPSWRRRRSSRCCTVPAASAAQSSASMKSLHGRPASCAALQPSSACSLGLLKLVRPAASSIQMPSSAVSTMRRYCSALSRRRRVITRAAEVARSRAVTSCQVSSASSALKATPAMAMPRTTSTAPACAKPSRLRTCTVQLRPAKPMYSCASCAAAGSWVPASCGNSRVSSPMRTPS